MSVALGIITRGRTPQETTFTTISRDAARREDLLEVFDRHYRRTEHVWKTDSAEWEDIADLLSRFALEPDTAGTGLVHTPVDWIIFADL